MSVLRRMSRADICTVLKSRKKIKSQHFSIVYNNTNGGYAVVVSKKTEKLAVNRNKTKRRIVTALKGLGITHYNLVIFVKSNIIDLPYKDVQKELQTLILKNINT